jgi:hypothetical protein
MRRANAILLDRFRCPECFLSFDGTLVSEGNTCPVLTDLGLDGVNPKSSGSLAEVIDYLRLERYTLWQETQPSLAMRELYYSVRPLMSVPIRRIIQKLWTRGWQRRPFPKWPVDFTVENLHRELMLRALKVTGVDSIPFIWFWPHGAQACLSMTHDVETRRGLEECDRMMDLDDSYGLKASFQLVPEDRYDIPPHLIDAIRDRGFEVAIHDLNHDGLLFSTRNRFLHRVASINSYGQKYGARGFRAALLYRRPEWYSALDFSFDMSVPNVGHLCAQRGGCCTVMPYFIGKVLEFPVTTSEDYTLLHLLDHDSIDLWKTQVRLVLENNGLITFIVHPDYAMTKSARPLYEELLNSPW